MADGARGHWQISSSSSSLPVFSPYLNGLYQQKNEEEEEEELINDIRQIETLQLIGC